MANTEEETGLIKIKVEFTYAHNPLPFPLLSPFIPLTMFHASDSGGLEIVFNSRRNLTAPLPKSSTIGTLITHLTTTYLSDSPKKDLFVMDDGNVRPGILVLVNDADWELEGERDCVLENGDEVVFVSTLHGG